MLKADKQRFESLLDDDEPTRIRAAGALSQLPVGHFEDHPVSIRFVADRLPRFKHTYAITESDAVREWIAGEWHSSSRRLSYEEDVAALHALAQDPDPTTRTYAVLGLRKLGLVKPQDETVLQRVIEGFHVNYDPQAPVGKVVEGIRRVMKARHGRDDVTIVTQDQMIQVLGSVLGVLTFAVGALGGRREQILLLFLGEAALLAATGGAAGLAAGALFAQVLALVFPALPVSTPWWFAVLAEAIAITVGLASGVIPAHRATLLDPVEALRAE